MTPRFRRLARLCTLVFLLGCGMLAHPRRVTLVIGNDNCQQVSRLQKTGNEGSFSDGLQAGTETLYFAIGDRYVGSFEAGVRHGKGAYALTNGQLKQLEYANGVEKSN
jgi:hypothetical protein